MKIPLINKNGSAVCTEPLKRVIQGSMVLLLFLSMSLNLHAQNVTVTGQVVDAENEPIIGATVTVLGNKSLGTITNVDGRYSISLSNEGGALQFSYVGYKTKIINVPKGSTKVDVSLEEDAVMLNETVVVAMDMRRDEKSLASAFQKVDMEGMTETRDANFINNLAGKVAGLQVVSNGPAGSASIVIRGLNSVTGNNQPLYVIDGIPIINTVNTGEMNIDYGNPAANINPDNIESMVVLKGANASALYGSDAANGAIIITTKKGSSKNGLGVTFSSNLQFVSILQDPIYQNVYGSGESDGLKKDSHNYINNGVRFDPLLPYGMSMLSYINQRSWGLPMLGFDVVGRNGVVKQYLPENSLMDLYQTARAWTNSVAIEKASDIATVRVSYTNINSNDVMMKQNEINRNNLNLRATLKASKFLDVETSVSYNNETADNRNSRNASKANPMYSAAWMPRDMSIDELTPWKTPEGRAIDGQNTGGFVNPFWVLNETSNTDKTDWLLGQISLNFKITNDLKLRLKGAVDYNAKSGNKFANMYGPKDVENGDGDYQEFQETYKNMTYEALMSYNKRWDKINVSVNVGSQSQDYTRSKLESRAQILLMPDMKSLANNVGGVQSGQNYAARKKQAVFGAASLGYGDFIYLDLTGRNDWTSTLPASDRSYFYSSVGASFIFTELVKSIPREVLSFAKLRGSYAKVGNDTGFDQLYDGFQNSGKLLYGTIPYFQSDTRKYNADLKPERTTSYELGADLRFWNNRVSVDFTYYDKTTRDQIINAATSYVSGYTSAMYNTGEIRNWGTELSLNVTPVQLKDFQWDINFNWAKNNSEVIKLGDGIPRMDMGGGAGVRFVVEEGRSLGSLYGRMPRLNENGQVLVNQEGKPMFDNDVFMADVEPKWIGGVKNAFKYKGFSASILFDFKKGGNIWSATATQASKDGQTISSLEGRDEYFFSNLVLGENNEERRGFLQTTHTVNPNATQNLAGSMGELVPYGDATRPKGILHEGAVYDKTVTLIAGQPNRSWINPGSYWMTEDYTNHHYLYDASFIKLRELSVGYDFSKSLLRQMGGFLQSLKVSLVGRNLAILHQNTPKGIDPEAASTLGVVRGLEKGFSLPTATYGFDIKVTF